MLFRSKNLPVVEMHSLPSTASARSTDASNNIIDEQGTPVKRTDEEAVSLIGKER